jgi:hypothetical protein
MLDDAFRECINVGLVSRQIQTIVLISSLVGHVLGRKELGQQVSLNRSGAYHVIFARNYRFVKLRQIFGTSVD